MIKKIRIVFLLVVIAAILAVVCSVTLLNANDMLKVNGHLQYKKIICYSDVFFIDFILLGNILLSSKFISGKKQDLLFFISGVLLISTMLGFVVFTIIYNEFKFTNINWAHAMERAFGWLDIRYLVCVGVIALILILFYVLCIDKSIFSFEGGKFTDKKLKQVDSNLENSRWMTEKEIEKNYKPTLYSKLGSLTKDGVPVGAKLVRGGRDLRVMFASPCHSIIIGSTGSGKTTTFVSPMIQLLAATNAGSSMVVTDPKGELYSLHSKYLKTRGYDVQVVDLRDTYSSSRWNPLEPVWDRYQEYVNANKNVYLRSDNALSSGLKLMDDEAAFQSTSSFYEFDGKAFASKDKLIESIKVYRKKAYDEVYEDLNDLCTVLIPVENDKDPMWEKGARSIVFATLLAMLEDSEDEKLGMTKDKFNFFNMTKILQSSVDDYKDLREYFKGRYKISKALSLSKQVCDAAPQTRASYMSIVYEKLSLFNDAGICALTSSSDIKADGLAQRPTALFLKIPDEKDTRHNLAVIFILNIYKTLIKIASAKEDLTLDRNVYFIMDEFGNMPKIEKFDKFITVGRSRKIWFTMIVQSYSQLNNVYGETVADIVKGNCGIKMFIGSNDANTCKEYSELCGNITVLTRSTSYGGEGKNASYSEQTQVRPLIYPSELQRLNHPGDIGHSVIVTFGNFPLQTYFTPAFLVPFYKSGKLESNEAERFFDEKAILYSALDRNNILKAEQAAKEGSTNGVELKMGTVNGQSVNPQEATKANEESSTTEASDNENSNKQENNESVKDLLLKDLEEYLSSHPDASINDFYKSRQEQTE